MKHFFRTIPGKVILFFVCIISMCTFIASIFGVVMFVEGDFYTSGEDEIVGRVVGNEIVFDWLDLYNNGIYKENDGIREYELDGNLVLNIYGSEDGIVSPDDITDDDNLSDENGHRQYDRLLAQTGNTRYNRTENRVFEYEAVMFKPAYNEAASWRYALIRSQYYSFVNDRLNNIYAGNNYIQYQKISASFLTDHPQNDRYALTLKVIHIGYDLRYAVFGIGIGAALLAIVCFIALMCVSARRPEDEELHPGPLHKMPFDLVLFCAGGGISFYIVMLCDLLDTNTEGAIVCFIVLPLALAVFLGFMMGVAARIKDRSIFTNTLIRRLLTLLKKVVICIRNGVKKFAALIVKLFVNLPMAWKAVAVIAVDAFINLMLMILSYMHDEEAATVFLVIKTLLIVGAAVFITMKMRTLQEGAAQLANGEFDIIIDTSGMLPEMKKHAANLSSIGNGMNTAVEQRLKSERMKAELITNVSHDIKTPLTSIINYTGLIANENCDNDKHSQYSEVLMRQAERLKRLLEDLVEASKASTGNLDVSLAPCDASVFVSQATGEYEEKLEAANLSLVVKQPEENLRIMADGRRMWRIFDNLMNNICKYSLPGSRVYLTLERFGDTARFLFKNTSRDVLDISEDELMERFVRGDVSRNTEGNGLGLSIAKSMAQLQNGELKVEIDGDLFKAILSFPLIDE
ncbi:MAG: HAMP domain-containing histidine kinase [Lachnospiraceae bacterium]|nr:HAMP domain-containing histidine kinase [Lachnospiraceae bacterium]